MPATGSNERLGGWVALPASVATLARGSAGKVETLNVVPDSVL
jgi:hypothetical protein